MRVGLLYPVTIHRLQDRGIDSLKWQRWRFRWDIRDNSRTERVVKHFNRVPRAVAESPFLEGFKIHEEVALEDTFQ